MNERQRLRVLKILVSALELESGERDGYIEKECGGEDELSVEVRRLLALENSAADFLEGPVQEADPRHGSATLDPPAPFSPESETAVVLLTGNASREGRIGPYRILEPLGEGGMGIVYLAEQSEPIRRRVALKVIKLGMDTREVVARFEAERQALALMDHPGIAKVYEAGATDSGRPYFAMEYVPGESITDYSDHHRLSTSERLKLFLQVCQAIDHAHHRGILHRDLKPSNILVGNPDDEPRARIIDFGVAKATNHLLTEKTIYTEIGRAVGTPAYMSPEQAAMVAGEVDHRTDIYSLGVVLYELLVGELPLDWESVSKAAFDEIRRRILEEEPLTPSVRWSRLNVERTTALAAQRQTSPSALRSQLRGDLDWITMKAIEKERSRRYATAHELAADIERHLRAEPVLAGPPSALYRLQKFARKNRGPLAAGLAVVLALAAGLVASLILYSHAKGAKEGAERSLQQAQSVVDEFFTEVSQSPELLGATPGTQALRKRLLKRARAHYEKFVAEHAGDVSLVNDLAHAHLRLAGIAAATGEKTMALTEYAQAIEIFERLSRESPSGAQYRYWLAESYQDVGVLQTEIGESDEALSSHRQALRMYEELCQENPSRAEYRGGLAGTYSRLGAVDRQIGKTEDAVSDYTQALQFLEQLSRENPSVASYRDNLGVCHVNLGLLHMDKGEIREAMTAYMQAVRILERLSAEDPSSSEHRNLLAQTYQHVGTTHLETGKTEEALSAYTKAIEIQERLARENPAVTEFQNALAASFNNVGLVHRETGKTEEALSAYSKAIEINERLCREDPDATLYRRRLAANYNNLGTFYKESVKPEEAIVAYTKAIEIEERLVREDPAVTDFQNGLALSYNNLGNAQSDSGKLEDALSAYTKAIEIQERLARENPAVTEYQHKLAGDIFNLGRLYRESGKTEEAFSAHRRSLEMRERLSRENPAVTEYQHQLASSYNSVGAVLWDAGKPDEALSAYKQALQILERLVRESPSNVAYARTLGLVYCNLGNVVTGGGDPEAALDWYGRAIETLNGALQFLPGDAGTRLFLRDAVMRRARALDKLGRHREAVPDWKQALELEAGKESQSFRLSLADSAARAGDYDLAAREAKVAPEAEESDGAYLYNWACVHSLCSAAAAKDLSLAERDRAEKAGEFAGEAMRLLRRSQEAGFFNDSAAIEHAKQDPDLAPLREREEFQELLKGLKSQ